MTLDVERTDGLDRRALHAHVHAPRGRAHAGWTPAPGLSARTYVLSLTTQDNASNVLTYGSPDPHVARYPRAPVVRLIGVDATFTKQSYLPGQVGALRISADAPSLRPRSSRQGRSTTHLRRLPARRRRGHRPGDDRLGRAAERAGDDQLPARRLAERLLLRQADRARRELRLRAVRRPAGNARRRVTGCSRPAHEHLAGLQLLRRRRGRVGRHVVHGASRRCRSSAVPQPWSAAVLLPLRPGLHALAVLDWQDRRLPLRPGRRGRRRRRALRAPTT